jgi:hypothetical protein
MLTDFEDSLLAMSDGEPASLAVAVQVLSSWHGRPVSREVVEQSACRLANLGLVSWVYRIGGRVHLGKKVGMSIRRSRRAAVLATKQGQQYLRGTKVAGS